MKGDAVDEKLRIPRVVGTLGPAAIRDMPLTPIDGFVLSRVDGTLSVADLAQATGLDDDAVSASLLKLAGLGAVTFDAPGASPPRSDSGTFSRTDRTDRTNRADAHDGHAKSPPAQASGVRLDAPVEAPAPPPSAQDEEIDLEPDLRARVNDLFARLSALDHYALLGVARDADRKVIKRTYYELAALFHPDRFFRKKLGTYKPKMEAIFARATLAHDVLTSRADRAEYDAYLGDVARSRAVEESIHEPAPAAAAPVIAPPSEAPPRPVSAPAPAAPAASAPSGPPPRRQSVPSMGAPRSPEDDARARRDALARRLLAGRSPSSPGPVARPTPPPVAPPGEILRRQHAERVEATRAAIAQRHAASAAAAMQRGDVAAALHDYKKALEFAPHDQELAGALEAASRSAQDALAETYERQAQYEQKNSQWPEAAASWCRLAELRPNDGSIQARAAHALVQAKGDLHRAANFGRRAVELEPENAAFRITLANVYLAAGLQKTARRELEAAQQLSPDDASISALLKRVGHS